MSAARAGTRLVFYPGFSGSERAELTDQFYRAMWYLYPVLTQIGRIVFAVEPAMAPGRLPHYLDPQINSLVDAFRPVQVFVPHERLSEELAEADIVLHWDTRVALPALKQDAWIENIDRQRHVEECQTYLNLSSKIGGSYSFDVQKSREKLRTLVAKRKRGKCYIFGTGPNLSQIANHNFSDGVALACNSMVKNTALLDRLNPPLIVAGDPIFHAGPSIYAADFRKHLYSAMERYEAHFLTNQRDYRVFHAHMPASLHARLIGAPVEWGLRMNTNPLNRFVFTACPNILTLFLIPLAFAFSESEICIAGCDGRPLAENSYFWKHDQSVQFNERMADIQEAHPSFFNIDYDDYYFLHCETVRRWLQQAEREGRTVINMTSSYIPALRARYRPPATVARPADVVEDIPFRIRASMRRVFLKRQWRVIRCGMLPRLRESAFNLLKAGSWRWA